MKYYIYINTMVETDVLYLSTKNKKKANKVLNTLRANGHYEAYKKHGY